MEIRRSGSRPSETAPLDYFTGTVRIDPLFQAPDPARVSGASVTFEPGARTAWHTHPLGQTLIRMRPSPPSGSLDGGDHTRSSAFRPSYRDSQMPPRSPRRAA